MSAIQTGAVHHLTLTVSDVQRSMDFYTELLGFQYAADYGDRKILGNGSTVLIVGPPPDPGQAISGDRFNENRVGLDHVSFSVESHGALEDAISVFDEHGVSHGEIKDLGEGMGLYVLAFRDPDNVQCELTAPYG